MTHDDLLLEARPSAWNFFWHWVFFWLILPPVIALWKQAALSLRVYRDRVVLEKGVLSKNIKEVFISDIRTVDTKQSVLQRMFKIGDVMIATAGTAGYEDTAYGLPDPMGIKELVMTQRRNSRGTND